MLTFNSPKPSKGLDALTMVEVFMIWNPSNILIGG
jgi:hypothetical protein